MISFLSCCWCCHTWCRPNRRRVFFFFFFVSFWAHQLLFYLYFSLRLFLCLLFSSFLYFFFFSFHPMLPAADAQDFGERHSLHCALQQQERRRHFFFFFFFLISVHPSATTSSAKSNLKQTNQNTKTILHFIKHLFQLFLHWSDLYQVPLLCLRIDNSNTSEMSTFYTPFHYCSTCISP